MLNKTKSLDQENKIKTVGLVLRYGILEFNIPLDTV